VSAVETTMPAITRLPAPLDGLSAAESAILAPHLEPVTFAQGRRLFRAGDVGDRCYIVDAGTVRVELGDDGGGPAPDDVVLGFFGPGSVVGEMSVLDRLPRSATGIAHTDVAARCIRIEGLTELARSAPEVALRLIAALGRGTSLKTRAINERFADLLVPQVDPVVEHLVARARTAQRLVEGWSEPRIDRLLLALAETVAEHALELAIAAVEETGIGNVRDKALKNRLASLGVYQHLAGQTANGLLGFDADRKVGEVARPVGVVVGLVPATHPVATFIFKTLIALKGRNALVLCPSRRAQGVSKRVGLLLQQVMREHGAPAGLVQWAPPGSDRRTTTALMRHPGVAMVLATGGAALVKAAYRSGTPTIGVGPGNAPVLIGADADLVHAARSAVESKAFDNGLVCGAENNLVVVASVRTRFAAELERAGAAVMTEEESARFVEAAIDPQTRRLASSAVGREAATLAEQAGIRRPHSIRLLVVPTDAVDADNGLAAEKLAPVLSLFTVADADEGLRVCRALLAIDGHGHTAIVHAHDAALVERFAAEIPASRILVNSPGTQGVMGLTTGLVPSMTLGCGTFGGTSTTDNVTYTHLLNIKRIAYYRPERASTRGPDTSADELETAIPPAAGAAARRA
jgi:acetaldehyde dehydrogenase / alcohol dehydrogenase